MYAGWGVVDGTYPSNDIEGAVEGFVQAVLGPSTEQAGWTVVKASHWWADHEPDTWAKTPCPECGLRSVRRRPLIGYQHTSTYWCTNKICGWEPPVGEHKLWETYFNPIPHTDIRKRHSEHPDGERTCDWGETTTDDNQIGQRTLVGVRA